MALVKMPHALAVLVLCVGRLWISHHCAVSTRWVAGSRRQLIDILAA